MDNPYCSCKPTRVRSSQYYDEAEYEGYPDLTDRHRAILKPPSAHTWQVSHRGLQLQFRWIIPAAAV